MNDYSTGSSLKKMAIAAKTATFVMAQASLEQKNGALAKLIEHLKKYQKAILHANQQDVSLAKANGLSAPLLERLSLENRLERMVHDIAQVIALPDPL